MRYLVILKNLNNHAERILLADCASMKEAELSRKSWRRLLGSTNWIVDRRPRLDSMYHLGLKIERIKTEPRLW